MKKLCAFMVMLAIGMSVLKGSALCYMIDDASLIKKARTTRTWSGGHPDVIEDSDAFDICEMGRTMGPTQNSNIYTNFSGSHAISEVAAHAGDPAILGFSYSVTDCYRVVTILLLLSVAAGTFALYENRKKRADITQYYLIRFRGKNPLFSNTAIRTEASANNNELTKKEVTRQVIGDMSPRTPQAKAIHPEQAKKGLKVLTKTAQDVQIMLEELEKERAPRIPTPKARTKGVKRKVARKSAKITATGMVFEIIRGSRKGVNMAALKKKTGFNEKKIRDIVYRLKKQGKIKSECKGVYLKTK